MVGAAISFAVSLSPKCLPSRSESNVRSPRRYASPLSVVLGLSLGLFALSVMEATPSSWLLVLNNRIADTTDDGSSRDDNDYLTVSFAYFIVLTSLCIYTLVVAPCAAGILIADRLLNRPVCNLFCCSLSERPWWIKFVWGLLAAVYRVLILATTLVYAMIKKCWKLIPSNAGGGMRRKDSNSGNNSLPLTNLDAGMNARRSNAAITDCMDRLQELILYRSGSIVFGSILGVATNLGLLQWAAPFIIEPNSSGNSLAVALSWVCAIGIILSSLLNGFGSVSMPHSCLAGLYLDPIKPETISKAHVDLQKTQESLQERMEQLTTVTLKPSSCNGTNSAASPKRPSKLSAERWVKGAWNFRKTVSGSFSGMGEDIAQRKRVLLDEISFLQTLVEEMREDIEEMKYTQAMEANARTTMGRIRSWFGMVLSVILLIRLYFAATSIWQHWHKDTLASSGVVTTTTVPTQKRDPVTTFLLWIIGNRVVTEKEYNNLSQFISLLLTAYLSLSQVRYFLRTLAAMHRRINLFFCGTVNRYNNNSNNVRSEDTRSNDTLFPDEAVPFQTRNGVYNHLLAALMGSYFMSCIVLTKMMLPWQYRAAFSGALGGFDAFIIQSDVVNALFAFSAVVSASVLAMLFGIQRQTALLHTASWREHQLSRPLSRHPEV